MVGLTIKTVRSPLGDDGMVGPYGRQENKDH
jgi:hypothetical protein